MAQSPTAYLAGPSQITLMTSWQRFQTTGPLAAGQTGLWVVVRQFAANNAGWPWQRDFLAARRARIPLVQLWAYDHLCLFARLLPLTSESRWHRRGRCGKLWNESRPQPPNPEAPSADLSDE